MKKIECKETELCALSLSEMTEISAGKFTWDENESFFYNIGAAIGYVAGEFTHNVIEPLYRINAPCY